MNPKTAAADRLPDEEIIARILAGERELYEILIRRYNPRLFRICRGYVRDEDEAEDILQGAYIKAYEALPDFRGRSKFSTWLTRIMINDALRLVKQRRRLVPLEQSPSRDRHAVIPQEFRAPQQESPSEEAMNNELKSILEQAIDGLPEKYRTVYMMREIEEMSVAETSGCLNISQTNVKVRLVRAKEMLRETISSAYRGADLFHFDLVRCDRIVANVLNHIHSAPAGGHPG